MNTWIGSGFAEAFLALFVAIDIPGLIPIYMGAVSGMPLPDQSRVLKQATLWAAMIGTSFFLAGNALLAYLGVAIADFQIAGGLLLVALSLHDLTSPLQSAKPSGMMFGVVPLAIPLMVGPAVMTIGISMIQDPGIGTAATIAALAANLVLVWASGQIALRIGQRLSGLLQAASKVVMILLAALGVNMVRRGLVELELIGRITGAGH